jgi:hypothetical protein
VALTAPTLTPVNRNSPDWSVRARWDTPWISPQVLSPSLKKNLEVSATSAPSEGVSSGLRTFPTTVPDPLKRRTAKLSSPSRVTDALAEATSTAPAPVRMACTVMAPRPILSKRTRPWASVAAIAHPQGSEQFSKRRTKMPWIGWLAGSTTVNTTEPSPESVIEVVTVWPGWKMLNVVEPDRRPSRVRALTPWFGCTATPGITKAPVVSSLSTPRSPTATTTPPAGCPFGILTTPCTVPNPPGGAIAMMRLWTMSARGAAMPVAVAMSRRFSAACTVYAPAGRPGMT